MSGISSNKYKCLEIHTDSPERLNNFIDEISVLVYQLQKIGHITFLSFIRSYEPEKNLYSIKMEFIKCDRIGVSKLNDLERKYAVPCGNLVAVMKNL